MRNRTLCGVLWGFIAGVGSIGFATAALAQPAGEQETLVIRTRLAELQTAIARLKTEAVEPHLLADVEIYAKAADWIVRHNEFYKPAYVGSTLAALETGRDRAAQLEAGEARWEFFPGKGIRAYRSAVDGSLQPYAVSLPNEYGQEPEKRWPLHVVLHGRDGVLNEVSFIQAHGRKPPVSDDWIQLDVFGRTNNAYRWSGETDVFEALAEVEKRFHIDPQRIVLRGFSMGGAGAWHLGLHHPSRWCSVGPGAGFVDFYKYQKVETPLPPVQHQTLHIYDAVDYVLNAGDVPVCTYGGEHDEQLVASTNMHTAAEKLRVPMKLLIGPGVGHKFHPDSFNEYMAFHLLHQKTGRPAAPGAKKLKFVTYTLKYNRCDWVAIEELIKPYQQTVVEGAWDEQAGLIRLTTENIAALRLLPDIILADHAKAVEIDGTRLALKAPDSSLGFSGRQPSGAYLQRTAGRWTLLDEQAAITFQTNAALHKRHNLQGPIDDAFMQPFVCVRGTGKPWSEAGAAWAAWTLERFSGEFDKWLRGRIPVISDTELTPDMIAGKNLILFGDPGSNRMLAELLPDLPVQWTREALTVHGQNYDPATHGLSLIYPNPINRSRYVVINSGHTFHEADFKKSNAWLFPRLGDIAVQKFERLEQGGYTETVIWADLFDSRWKLASGPHPKPAGK